MASKFMMGERYDAKAGVLGAIQVECPRPAEHLSDEHHTHKIPSSAMALLVATGNCVWSFPVSD